MEYRQIGSSELKVSTIGLGSWLTYAGGVTRDQTAACTKAAFDAGITFFDTANVYGGGAAEEAWGEILADYPRADYVLATKLYFQMPDGDHGLSREQVHKQLDASLRRLKVDYVDLYQCHRYDEETPLEETMAALTEVVDSGKVRYVGFSEWTAEQIEAARAIPGVVPFVSSQPQYSLLYRAPETNGVLATSREQQVSQVVWSPLAQGVLTGKYKPGEPVPEGTRAASEQMGRFLGASAFMRDEVLEAVQQLGTIADGLGLSTAQLALAWVLRDDNVASAITGATRPEQVNANVAASGVKLSDETLAEIDGLFEAAVVE
ncbi:MAG TPA: aldo/keto reductase family protein [Conexibacter sp.]|jgi:aryl-alcohol dehydrogenase-like predicted oxidoreductase